MLISFPQKILLGRFKYFISVQSNEAILSIKGFRFFSRKFSIQQKVVTATIGVSKRVLPDLLIQGQRVIHKRNIPGQ